MAVISTVSHTSPTPESALIAFAEIETFEIIFETFHISRKYENLLRDPHVSVVIGWDTTHHVTLQYEGLAYPVPDKEVEGCIRHFLRKDTPCSEEFLRDVRVRLFRIQPCWLRFSDYTGKPPKIIEHTF